MSNKRVGYEMLIILLLILLAAGIWWWKDREAGQVAEEAEAARLQQVTELRGSGETWARALATSEARAAFGAFAAGIQPQVQGGNPQSLHQAIGALLELPAVSFVHVLGEDGTVLASSDRKLSTTGRLGTDAAWVLESSEVVEQEGSVAGSRELAAPVVGAAGPVAYLWMGYDTAAVLRATRPADWPGSGAGGTPDAAGDEVGEPGGGGGAGGDAATPTGEAP